MQGRAPLWGPLAIHVIDHNFQLCYSSASHTLLPRRHKEAQNPKAGIWRPKSSPGSASTGMPMGRLPHPRPLNSHSMSEKGTTQATCRVPSGSKLRFKVHFQSFATMYITPDIQKVSFQCLQEDGEDSQFGNKAAS